MSSSGAPSSAVSPAQRAASSALQDGDLFAGRYRVVRSVASGGMGTVYEVIHTETERRRALKVMHPHLFKSDEMRERFKREARIAAQVDSEYIVDVVDAGFDEATQTPFIVMELLEGEELGGRLKRLGRLPADEVSICLRQVALALDQTHAKLIVHRDLKPDNVFLTHRQDGSLRVKILDFGVAKVVAEGATEAGVTRSLGTPLYMAPEQFRVGSKLTAAADIYALGMMAYTLLVGQPYWAHEARDAGDVIAFAMAVVQGPRESAADRAARQGVTLPPGFDGWFARVSAPSPGDRYTTASEAVQALVEVLAPPRRPAQSSPVARAQAAQPAMTGTAQWTAPAQPSSAASVAHPPLTTEGGTMAWVAPSARGVPAGVAAEPIARPHAPTLPLPPSPAITAPRANPASSMAPSPAITAPRANPPVPAWAPAPGGIPPQAAWSTGAATPTTPLSPNRTPLFAAGVLLGLAILGGGAWLAIGALQADTPALAGPADTTAAPSAPAASAEASTPAQATAPVAPSAEPAPAPASSGSSTAAVVEAPPASALPTAATGKLPAPKQTTTTPGKPVKPATTPTAKPLLGRD